MRRKVGFVLRDDANRTLDAVSVVTGRCRSDLVEEGIRVTAASLPVDQRKAVEAVVISAKERAAS
jgi:hypothetical protein